MYSTADRIVLEAFTMENKAVRYTRILSGKWWKTRE
jgi:hypothetical protein